MIKRTNKQTSQKTKRILADDDNDNDDDDTDDDDP